LVFSGIVVPESGTIESMLTVIGYPDESAGPTIVARKKALMP
jgi:hypothetical protein